MSMPHAHAPCPHPCPYPSRRATHRSGPSSRSMPSRCTTGTASPAGGPSRAAVCCTGCSRTTVWSARRCRVQGWLPFDTFDITSCCNFQSIWSSFFVSSNPLLSSSRSFRSGFGVKPYGALVQRLQLAQKSNTHQRLMLTLNL
eukprot:scaffold110772_cov60-Phaeocystis_antarctica.AAC.3